ncbi:poly(3-hydroxybutyrate) depolymerase [Actinobacteria bacterium IMCC26256]|nr:poly(3-hydroxybutyrate) depolymerase [Actinobacteria bacterium IMCC26256]
MNRFVAASVVSLSLVAGVSAPAWGAPVNRPQAPIGVAIKGSPGCAIKNSAVDLAIDAKIDVAVPNVAPELSTRWYYRHIPPQPGGIKPLPLVVDLHGYSEGATVHQGMSSLGRYGDKKGFITVTPQGQGVVPRWDTALKGSPDAAFIKAMISDVEKNLCIDTNRVFVAGLSNGAFMSSALAFVLSKQIAAIAPVAGVQAPKGCRQERAVPVVAFHGTADGFVGYDGGLGERARSLPAADGSGKTLEESGQLPKGSAKGPSVPETIQAIARRNSCSPKRLTQRVSSEVTRFSYKCSKGRDVVLYRVTGGGHTWPGSAFSQQIESVVGKTTMTISANEIMWRFFADHPLVSNAK